LADLEPDIAFGPFNLDRRARRLTRDGVPIMLGGKGLDVLAVLASAAGDTVSNDTLLDQVWPGVTVEQNNIQVRISALRRTLGDGWIVTVPGRGYRLSMTPPSRAPSIPDRNGARPSIAVLRFQNLSGDIEQEYFADGIVEDIITSLCRIRWLFVAARNSGFAYKNQTTDIRRIARELGVRYLLEGSVRKSNGRIRITAQLVEAETGTHLWADRFDGLMEHIFDLQDQIAISVAGVIEPTLQSAETIRAAGRPTSDLTAYDAYLRAFALFLDSGRPAIPEALALLETAIASDPGYGPALALAGLCCMRLCSDGSSDDPEADRLKGSNYARRALAVAGDDPVSLANAAQSLAVFGEDIDAMIALVDRALRLNPGYARCWLVSAMLHWMRGDQDVALEHWEAAARLSPRARVGGMFQVLGAVHLAAGNFADAAANLLLAIQDQPRFPQPYRLLAACYAHMGRLEDARRIVERLRSITSRVLDDYAVMRDPNQRALLATGLRLAAGDPDRTS